MTGQAPPSEVVSPATYEALLMRNASTPPALSLVVSLPRAVLDSLRSHNPRPRDTPGIGRQDDDAVDPDDLYGEAFFRSLRAETSASAAVVVPLVTTLVAARSVVDIGCGEGWWLAQFQAAGATEVLGVDGRPMPGLQIEPEEFLAVDLEREMPALDRRFDLAVCLEVAEHLPAEQARPLVATLTTAAPTVLFSAAIPGQVGTGHVNCQWPDYWAALFAEHGYRCIDCLRPRIWGVEDVAFYYQQNMVLYLGPDEPLPPGTAAALPARRVHAACYEDQRRLDAARSSTRGILRELAARRPAWARRR